MNRRWLSALGWPLAVASGFLSAALATAGGPAWADWLFLPAVLLVPVWIGTLAYLAIRSDTNASPAADVRRLPDAVAEQKRRAA